MRTLLLLGIIVAMNFNITHLRHAASDSVFHARVGLHYATIQRFIIFRWSFLLYLLLPTVLLIVRVTVLEWSVAWLNEALYQLSFLAVFAYVTVSFSPTPDAAITRGFDAQPNADEQLARHHIEMQQREQNRLELRVVEQRAQSIEPQDAPFVAQL